MTPPRAGPFWRQLLRYGLVGGITYVVDLAVFLAGNAWQPQAYLEANVAGRLAGAVAGFVLHKTWTFEDRRSEGTARQALLYALLLAGNVAASSLLLAAAVQGLGLAAGLARPAIDVLIIGSTFVLSRRIFRAEPARLG